MRETARTLVCLLALLFSAAGLAESALAAAATPTITGPSEVTGASFEVTVTFSEGVTGFTQSEVTVGNGSATGFTAESTTVYKVTIAPTAGYNGNVTVDVPAGVAQSISDSANNLAAAQFSTTATFASACATGSAVSDKTNTGLVADCAALLAGEDTLKGTATLNWDANTSISSWNGIALSGLTPQRVIRVEVGSRSLNGSIPTQLGNLSALLVLNLQHNKLSGSIPQELGSLSELTKLEMQDNMLSGSIPKELGNLTKLTHLHLPTNRLSGSIPKELGGLSALTLLNLGANQLSGRIPEELGNLTNLTNLYLYDNELSGSIPEELGNLSALKDLWLHDNQLTGSIPTQLGDLSALQKLYLYENQLTGSIPPELSNLSNLIDLDLDSNRLSGSIPTELGGLAKLQYLLLSKNLLSGEIPIQLGNLAQLKRLYLQFNHLSGSIPSELGNLINLTRLRLQCNQFTGTIPASLGALTALEDADFRGNQLTGGIPDSMSGLPVKLDEPIDCTRAVHNSPGNPHNSNDENNWPPRLTVTLTCPTGPLTEGETLSCTLTLKNTGGEKTLTDITWRLPTLGVGPQTLIPAWPRDPPGELKPGRSVKLQLAYGPLSPRRGTAELALSQVLIDGTTTQPTRLVVPWPAPLPLTVIADSEETDAVTVTHMADVRALAPSTFAGDEWPQARSHNEDSIEGNLGVTDEVTYRATAGPPPRTLLRVALKRSLEPANDGQASNYTLTITNVGRHRWLSNLEWWSPTLRRRGQVGDDGRLRPGESAVVELPYQPANFRGEPAMFSVIVSSTQTGTVALTHVETDSESTVAVPASTAASNENGVTDAGGVNDESGVEEEILATVTAPPSRSPLQVELRMSEEPVAVGQAANYTLIITNTSRYWSLSKLHWSSPTLGIAGQDVDDGRLRPGETVVVRLAYEPAHVRWQPAALAVGRVYGIRGETVRLEPLTLAWPEPLPLMITVSGRLKVSEDEYRPVTTHASYVSALHAPSLTLQSVPWPAGQPASVGIAAAREVRVVPAATPLNVTYWNTFNPQSPLYPLLLDFMGGTVMLSPQIRAPADMTSVTESTFSAYLVAAPPAPLERAPVGNTTAMLDMAPRVRIGEQFVKRRENDNGVVRSLVGNTVTVLRLLDANGAAITHLDKPLELRVYLPGSRLPPGVTHADVYWARWDAAQQQWQPLPTRSDGDHLIGAAQQLGLFGVIAATPPSRDLESGMRYYYTTGKHVGFAFKEYFDAHGGVARFGYPVTNEFQRAGLTVQYFEKARFEYRPHLAGTPAAVTLGRLGDELLTLWDAHQPRAAEPSEELPPTVRYFPETGHYVAHGFLAYFNANGGVERFGFPLTGEFHDPELGRTVQYFQRQRLAWNAESGRVEEMPDIARVLILAGDPMR